MEISLIISCLNKIYTLPILFERFFSLNFSDKNEMIGSNDDSSGDTFHFCVPVPWRTPQFLRPLLVVGSGAAFDVGSPAGNSGVPAGVCPEPESPD